MIRLSTLASLLLVPIFASAQEWPSFRGPNASGIADGPLSPRRNGETVANVA